MRVLVIQNCSPSLPGVVGEVLERRGAELVLNDAEKGEMPPPDDAGFDGLLVLGGPMNAEEDHLWPHLPETAGLIRRFHEREKPFLGICLGSQLAARAFGKKVHRHGAHERGFVALEATDAAREDAVFKGLAPSQTLFEWHEDTFDLPDQAALLLTGAACRNQAFRVGATSYAFQCHIEVTPDLFALWHDNAADYIARVDPGFPGRIAEQMPRHYAASRALCEHVTGRWTDLVETRAARP